MLLGSGPVTKHYFFVPGLLLPTSGPEDLLSMHVGFVVVVVVFCVAVLVAEPRPVADGQEAGRSWMHSALHTCMHTDWVEGSW